MGTRMVSSMIQEAMMKDDLPSLREDQKKHDLL